LHPLNVNQNILIFDSGLGGISIYQELKTLMPNYSITYVADSLYLPYGELPDTEIKRRSLNLILELSKKVNAMMIIVACNTASTLILDELRAKTHRLIVGVIPAIKPAAKASHSRHITLLATPATVTRSYTKQLIKNFASDCEVQCIGSSELVHIAEEKIRNNKLCQRRLQQILNQVSPKSDTVVLGCTHFPLLKEEINEFFNGTMQLVDSSEAVAKRALSLLLQQPKATNITSSHHYYDTKRISNNEKNALEHLGFTAFTTIKPLGITT
jgi:glutamate racemase